MRKGTYKSFLAFVRGQTDNPYQKHGDDKNKSDHKDWLAGYESIALEKEKTLEVMH